MNLEILNYKINIDDKYKFSSVVSALLFFITHAYYFLGRYANEDYMHSIFGRSNTLGSGRWLGEIYPNYLIPWVVGVICCILLIITVNMIISIFEVENKVSIILISGLMVSFPTLAYGYGYLFMADIYSVSLCSAVAAVWFTSKFKKYGFISGGFFLMISLAEYQSYIGIAMATSLFKLIFDLIKQENEDRDFVKYTIKFILMGILGVIFYFIGLKIILNIYNTSLGTYKGVDSMRKIPLEDMPMLIKRTYINFFGYFLGKTFFYSHKALTVTYFVSLINSAILVVYLFIKNVFKSNRPKLIKILLLILFILVVPICCNPVDFMAPEASASTLNIYAVVMLFIFPIILFNLKEFYSKNIIKFIVIISSVFILINNYLLSNIYYLKLTSYYEQTSMFYNRLLTRIELTDGFREDMPIAVISNSGSNFYGIKDNDFPVIQKDQGLWGRFIGINSSSMISNNIKVVSLMENIFGINLKRASEEDLKTVLESEEIKNMRVYPEKDSIKIIDDILVVNLCYNFSVNIYKDNGVIKCKLDNYNYEGEIETAWYFYKDGERIDTKWYEQTDYVEFNYVGSGEYKVTCFIKDLDGNNISVIDSNTISI